MKQALIVVVVALGVVGVAPLGVADAAPSARTALPASIMSLSARQIATLSLASARAKGACTNVVSGAAVGFSFGTTTRSSADAAEQTIHFNKSRGEARLVRGTAYVKLSASLIALEFGRSAPQFANKWIAITRANKVYRSVATGMSFPSMLSQLRPAGVLRKSKVVTLDGVKVIALSGAANAQLGLRAAKQTLFVSVVAPYLPVALDAAGRSQGVPTTLTVTFSHWGQPPRVTAPSSIPLSSTPLAARG
ncbi:MAG: hypothetical protein HIU57_03185 [Acidobacteria bacterium]|nr:hypothetical protein [Acidobacteriota bacterium]